MRFKSANPNNLLSVVLQDEWQRSSEMEGLVNVSTYLACGRRALGRPKINSKHY